MARFAANWLTMLLLACCIALSLQGPVIAEETDNSESLVTLVIGLLHDEDKDIRALAFEQVRSQAPGRQATEKFAEQLAQLPGDAQVGLLSALADRGDAAARPTVVACLGSESIEVRVAALEALGALGGSDDVPRLVEWLSEGSAQEQSAARKSLERMPGDEVTASILNALRAAPTEQRVSLIEVLTARRSDQAVAQLLKESVSPVSELRAAAMRALGELAGPEHVGDMLAGVLKAERGAERAAAEKAVMFVCQRAESGEQATRSLLTALEKLPPAERLALLPTAGRIGGPEVLRVVESAIDSRDPREHAAGMAAIANWPNASIAPRLMELAQADSHPAHRITATRALIRVAPLPDDRSDAERLDLLKKAMEMCQRDADRLLVLQRASAVRIPETLRFVLPYVDRPAYSDQACETIVELAHHRNLREPNEEEFHAALDKVIATTKDPVLIDRAQRYKRDQTWVRPRSK